jgi:hypothetical protein
MSREAGWCVMRGVLALGLTTLLGGCASGGGSGDVHGSVYMGVGVGYYDPWYWGGCCDDDVVVIGPPGGSSPSTPPSQPPSSAPPRPTHPIAKPPPAVARPMPAAPRPTAVPRGGGGRRR